MSECGQERIHPDASFHLAASERHGKIDLKGARGKRARKDQRGADEGIVYNGRKVGRIY
jgi:hypothetical protein